MIAATTSARAPATQRRGAPETLTTPSASAPSTRAEPRSGCSSTRPIGTAATTTASSRSRLVGGAPRSRRSARMTARPTHRAILAISEGCTEKPPGSWIQECEPLIVEPTGDSTSTSPSTEAT